MGIRSFVIRLGATLSASALAMGVAMAQAAAPVAAPPVSAPAAAPAPAPAVSAAASAAAAPATPAADGVHAGDHYNFSTRTCGFYEARPRTGTTASEKCAPGGVNLTVIAPIDTAGFITVEVNKLPDHCPATETSPKDCSGLKDSDLVETKVAYRIKDVDVQTTNRVDYGLTVGALVVPFKLALHHGGNGAGGSLGGYIGYQMGIPNTRSLAVIAAVGANVGGSQSTTSTTSASTSTTTTTSGSNNAPYNGAIGLLINIYGSTQGTFLLGRDFGGTNGQKNVTWLSFGIAFGGKSN